MGDAVSETSMRCPSRVIRVVSKRRVGVPRRMRSITSASS
jgi:hypothetical protein